MTPRHSQLNDQEILSNYLKNGLAILRASDLKQVKDIATNLPQQSRCILQTWAGKKMSEEDRKKMTSQLELVSSLQQLCTMRKMAAYENLTEAEAKEATFRYSQMDKKRVNQQAAKSINDELDIANAYMILVNQVAVCLSISNKRDDISLITTFTSNILSDCSDFVTRNRYISNDANSPSIINEALQGIECIFNERTPTSLYENFTFELINRLISKLVAVRNTLCDWIHELTNKDLSEEKESLLDLKKQLQELNKTLSQLNLSAFKNLRSCLAPSNDSTQPNLIHTEQLARTDIDGHNTRVFNLSDIIRLCIGIFRAESIESLRVYHESIMSYAAQDLALIDNNLPIDMHGESGEFARMLVQLLKIVFDYKRGTLKASAVFAEKEDQLSASLVAKNYHSDSPVAFIIFRKLLKLSTEILTLRECVDKSDFVRKCLDITDALYDIAQHSESDSSSAACNFMQETVIKIRYILKIPTVKNNNRGDISHYISELQHVFLTSLFEKRLVIAEAVALDKNAKSHYLACIDSIVNTFELSHYPSVAETRIGASDLDT